jgi:hypothetical protein
MYDVSSMGGIPPFSSSDTMDRYEAGVERSKRATRSVYEIC